MACVREPHRAHQYLLDHRDELEQLPLPTRVEETAAVLSLGARKRVEPPTATEWTREWEDFYQDMIYAVGEMEMLLAFQAWGNAAFFPDARPLRDTTNNRRGRAIWLPETPQRDQQRAVAPDAAEPDPYDDIPF